MRWLAAAIAALAALALYALWPRGPAPVDPDALLAQVTEHCLAPFPTMAFYEAPAPWTPVEPGRVRALVPNIAIEEAIGYAAFATSQSEGLVTDPDGRWWGLTDEAFDKERRDQAAFTRRAWIRFYAHPSGAVLAATPGPLEEGDDPMNWETTRCWLWHPDPGTPLSEAILARWDVAFGDRVPTPVGTMSRLIAPVSVDGHGLELEAKVMRVETGYAAGLAPVILKLTLREPW